MRQNTEHECGMTLEKSPAMRLKVHGYAVLDGGLATTLEANGCDCSDGNLWSAASIGERGQEYD